MYEAPLWGPDVSDEGWRKIERPHVMMISRMIRNKPFVPHEIIRAELVAGPMVVDALFQTVTYLQRIQQMDPHRYPRLALQSSQFIASEGHTRSWYARILTWFVTHGLQIDHLPPFRYNLDTPLPRLTREQANRLIRSNLLGLHIHGTWIAPSLELGTKMQFYRDHLMRLTNDGFIMRPNYMDIHMSHAMRIAINQIRVSSHRLRIETGRAERIDREAQICTLCSLEVETEEHYICRCLVYDEIRGRFHDLFVDGPGLFSKIMDFPRQRYLGLFYWNYVDIGTLLRELRPHPLPAPRQQAITNFFQALEEEEDSTDLHRVPIIPHPRGVTLARASALQRTRRPRAPGSRPKSRHQSQIRDILRRHNIASSRNANPSEVPNT